MGAPIKAGSDDQGPAEAGDRGQKFRSKLETDGEKPADAGGRTAGAPVKTGDCHEHYAVTWR